MVTVSHIVQKIVNERPLLFQAMEQDIVSFGNLAEQLHPEIKKELGKEIKHSAIVMALRRYAETMQSKNKIPNFDFHSEINMKTNLVDINVQKSPKLFDILQKIQSRADYARGDFLNIINGNFEVSIISNAKHLDFIKKQLKGEKIINVELDLVALSLNFSKEFWETPGVINTLVRKLTWEDINIFELISTFTEITFIISEKDSSKGFKVLQKLVKN